MNDSNNTNCTFCNSQTHDIHMCDSVELRALYMQYECRSWSSCEECQLPTYESSRFIQWLVELPTYHLRGLNSLILYNDGIEERDITIARLALRHSERFPYHRCESLYRHPLIEFQGDTDTDEFIDLSIVPTLTNINKSLIENIWTRIIESQSQITYEESNLISMEEGHLYYYQYLAGIDYTGENESILFDLADAMISEFNRRNPETICEPDENMVFSYVGYGITSADIYRLHPNIDEYRRNILGDEIVYQQYDDDDTNERQSDYEYIDISLNQPLDIVFEIIVSIATDSETDTDTNSLSSTDCDNECIICCNNQTDTKFNCQHEYCGNCTYALLDHIQKDHKIKPVCPLCRANITNVLSKNEDMIEKMKTGLLQQSLI